MQNDLFSPEDKTKLLNDLHDGWNQAGYWYHFNNRWDLFFKITLLAISVFSVIAAGTIATKYKDATPPWWLAIFNASAAALVTAVSAFIINLHLDTHAQTYEIKRDAFGALARRLDRPNPKLTRDEVDRKLDII